ncbi:TVP38/TMEM64 family protein [Candidatus Poribacteria bacterium]|nr:TVP38/TMEM64 family protein [Candidatus Poribacteria bacterium]MBT5537281.1 TVP38/TMEM64 family protein [Candidatus Poribacteria bacterium]MBT5712272.1 TVP38/TMEM64 family protein [Candidatus Poribacteria bacterium]MBT7100886.1 TVP38/TMEM64 family protein [Candidatus Poribacteria bacterium]MBT7804579.1 TVP38/TMEM64 family protein [Candidatus Poribacteria bacterium]
MLVAAVLAIIAGGRQLGLAGRVGDLRAWIESLGVWGPAVYVVVYAVLVTLAVPATPLTATAGAMFGSVLGVVVVSVGSTAGAVVSMLVARYLLRDAMARRFEANERFQQLNRLFETQGAVIVVAIRLIPVFPFGALNYAFGLTNVRLGTYTFWSWLCMLPMTVIIVVGSDAVVTTIREGGVPWALVVTVAAMAGIMTLLVRQARRKLKADV